MVSSDILMEHVAASEGLGVGHGWTWWEIAFHSSSCWVGAGCSSAMRWSSGHATTSVL